MAAPPDLSRLKILVADRFTDRHRVAFAALAPSLAVQHHSPNLSDYLLAPAAPLAGQPLTTLFPEFVGAETALAAILSGERPELVLAYVNRSGADGARRYLNLEVRPLAETAPAEGLLLLIEDVTEVGRLQQRLVQERNELRLAQQSLSLANADLRQLNQMKSVFLSVAAHDLRAPLTAIYGYADLLARQLPSDNPRQTKPLRVIRTQAERMHRLIEDLLSLDQIERSKLIITPQATPLQTAVAEVIEALQTHLEAARQAVTLSLPAAPLLVYADPGKLVQIVYNLFSNAAKYTPEEGHIEVTATAVNGQVKFTVRNSGPAMSPAQVGQLFDLYYRTEDVRRRRVAGSGLGLYIVKMLVEAQGGRVAVTSAAEVGTTFTVQLPLAEPAAS